MTFNDPEIKRGPGGEEIGYPIEPSIVDLEVWLEFQAQQLGTPVWWEELEAMLGIKDPHKFT